jgi:hypothetical protein
LSSIHWREAWKYGERAFRYCQHDIGHAIATVRYAAAVLGWKAKLLDVSDAAISDVLGLAREEDFSGIDEADREHPAATALTRVPRLILNPVRCGNSGAWAGLPNVLSPTTHDGPPSMLPPGDWRRRRLPESLPARGMKLHSFLIKRVCDSPSILFSNAGALCSTITTRQTFMNADRLRRDLVAPGTCCHGHHIALRNSCTVTPGCSLRKQDART